MTPPKRAVTEQYRQPNINLLPDTATFQGFLGVSTPIPGAALTPLPLTIESITDPLIFHASGSSDLTFLANGRVVAQWNVSINNALNARTQSLTFLSRSSAGGPFFAFLGPLGFGYHRNIATGADTASGQHQFNVAQNDVIRLASLRTAGVGALSFVGFSCELLVHFFPDI